MKKNFLTALIVLCSAVSASFESVAINPSSVRIGNISGFKKGDILIPCTDFTKMYLSGSYLIPFGLEELAMQEAALFFEVKNTPLVLSFKNFGNSDYRENTITAASEVYSFKGISLIPSINYFNLRTVLGSEFSWGADLTARYNFTESLTGIMSVKNIYVQENEKIDIPVTMHINFRYSAPAGFAVYTGMEKDDTNDAIFKTGLEYIPMENFSFSAGYNFDPQVITAGFSIWYKNLTFNYGMSWHSELEDSHCAGIVYEF